jgi:outer membrane protein OmpA-like peptidoglycan-associated protein
MIQFFLTNCQKKIKYVGLISFATLLLGCGGGNSSSQVDRKKENKNSDSSAFSEVNNIQIIDLKRTLIKLGHAINTSENEYLPILNSNGSRLYFSAMDRTGFFDFKLDFTKQKSAGGEDIYYSDLVESAWSDARPLSNINTNGHEVVTHVFENGNLIIAGNYPEKLGVKENQDAGVQTTDLFYLKKTNSIYQIKHFQEPVNSIYTESDAWMNEDESIIIFVSDRPGNTGEYHKKGWKWNESFWGNTDVYVSLKDGDYWTVPINLGSTINSPGAERTPWLSEDGLTMFVSSNGYLKNKSDLNVYAFKRKDLNNWTDWQGPFEIKDANTAYDDWGYKELKNGDAYIASAYPLGFKPTQGGKSGDGGFRETNFRSGYEIHGLQIAALNSQFETNIYILKKTSNPTFVINDVFFDFDSYLLKKTFEKHLDLIIDQIKQNPKSTIEIKGHTDNLGKKEYNEELSIKRADAIKLYFLSKGVKNQTVIKGYGDRNPLAPNTNSNNRKMNRRVEIFLKD